MKQQFFERLLRELFLRRGEGFVLKGGAAMQALFGEHRLTKDIDLDFANPKRTADSLHNTVGKAIRSAARWVKARELQVSEPGKTEHSPRWKINFEDEAGNRHHLEVEVSRDPERAPSSVPVQVRYEPRASVGIAPFHVDVYDRPALVASKLAALLGREVPRDVYDLDQLLAPDLVLDPKLIAWAIRRAGIGNENPVTVLHAHLEALDWSRFETELLPALPPEIAERMDAGEWDAMRLRVGERLERCLR